MKKLHLPYVNLPSEFITLLKSNLSVTTSPAPIFDVIRPNKALYMVLEKAFQEFDDGRGLEKTMMALGWANFRDRAASLYISKFIYGEFPQNTSMELVEDVMNLEQKYLDHGVHSFSRLFLLGFYLKLANIQVQRREHNQYLEVKVPDEVGAILKLSQGRSEKIDWLILIIMHLLNALGDKMLTNALLSGKKFEELYELMSPDARQQMMNNLLAYGASIKEQDIFLYEKI
ncbi:hypothetical protein [Peredibacter starrii]|uniref:Uncharacterized protein n=1 Tax=Peredibacter starrii TaxID=28202 RepID=A0AAX4HLA7_9BACT|nr:hypothetical protein [Peredibacter starrii]WPU64045.1 hypothetical protein SOO65_15215 [Peredibacter starrii]